MVGVVRSAAQNITETVKVWHNVYNRIRYFKKMYPLSAIAKDAVLFPLDYFRDGNDVTTLRNLTIAITHKCNIRCEMCYFHKELENRKELPFEDYTKVIDAALGSRPCVILSGGEPFAHPRILDMVAYAKGKGLPVQIFTNGTLVKPAVCDELVRLGLDYIDFTLLGNPESHAQVAKAPRSYQMFEDNLTYFAANRGNTKVILNYTITPRSVRDIDHSMVLAQRLNLDGIRYQHYNFLLPSEFGAQTAAMCSLFGVPGGANEVEVAEDLSGIADFLSTFRERLEREMPDMRVQWAPTLSNIELFNWYSSERFDTKRKCMYPWRGVTVDADAKLYPCNKIYLELGSLKEKPFFEIWNSDRMKTFRSNLKKRLYPACSRCCKL